MILRLKFITTDMNPEMAPAGYVSDECIQVPRCTADNYVELLLQICKEKVNRAYYTYY